MKKEFNPFDSLIPVFIEREIPKKVEQIATAVFVKNNMGYFLFTAAHVTDNLIKSILLIPLNGYLQEIHGYFAYIDLPKEMERAGDYVDIAYIKLPTNFAEELIGDFEPITGRNIELIENATELSICSVVGYPINKGRKKDKVFSSEPYSFSGIVAKTEVYDSLDLESSTNIVLHFDRKKVKNSQNGKFFVAPSLKGVSGGGIFAWDKNFDKLPPPWSERKFVGIFHTYKERDGLIIGATLLPFLAALSLGKMKKFGGIS